ncbi:MAG: DUF5103 domain-containing protein [Flavobacteriaceae bacterium]|nr:MAG: DUF5103 domain-containing protein [Flavobacteriaceae bacterium]
MKNYLLIYLILFINNPLFNQEHIISTIKSVELRPLAPNQFSSIVPLGTVLELSFDDLDADQKNYYYKVEHMSHDWKPSRLMSNQYIDGFQSNIILDVNNSFNTFQNYTHYAVKIPNRNTIITKSGNYLLSVLNEYDEVVFTRRFVLYEDAVIVGVATSRSRNVKTLNTEQTVQFTVNYSSLAINNPNQEIHVAVIQNQNWDSAITGLQPQFFRANQLIYRYINKSNFSGGNQYLNFDSKILRNKSINIVKIERKEVYHHYLLPFKKRRYPSYSYNPDINGQFVIRTLEGADNDTEADYAMMHFTFISEEIAAKDVYIFGGFNNFELTPENKMSYDEDMGVYFANILLKQGFYNYTYITKDNDETVYYGDIMGDFSVTENEYTVIVYFKQIGGLYDRVIGVGNSYFAGER